MPGLGAKGASFAGTQGNSVHDLGCSISKAVWDRGWASGFLDGHPRGRGRGGVSVWASPEWRRWSREPWFVLGHWPGLSSRLCHHTPNQKLEEGLGTQMGKKAAPYRQLSWRKYSGQSSGGQKSTSQKPWQSAPRIRKAQTSSFSVSSAPSIDEARHHAKCKRNTFKGSKSIFTEPTAMNECGAQSQ